MLASPRATSRRAPRPSASARFREREVLRKTEDVVVRPIDARGRAFQVSYVTSGRRARQLGRSRGRRSPRACRPDLRVPCPRFSTTSSRRSGRRRRSPALRRSSGRRASTQESGDAWSVGVRRTQCATRERQGFSPLATGSRPVGDVVGRGCGRRRVESERARQQEERRGARTGAGPATTPQAGSPRRPANGRGGLPRAPARRPAASPRRARGVVLRDLTAVARGTLVVRRGGRRREHLEACSSARARRGAPCVTWTLVARRSGQREGK